MKLPNLEVLRMRAGYPSPWLLSERDIHVDRDGVSSLCPRSRHRRIAARDRSLQRRIIRKRWQIDLTLDRIAQPIVWVKP